MAPEGLGADEARTAEAVRASRAGVALAVIMDGLLSPGHVFPEFKESDAMFAAERVSSGCWVSGIGCLSLFLF